jgi:hypothetical protein
LLEEAKADRALLRSFLAGCALPRPQRKTTATLLP